MSEAIKIDFIAAASLDAKTPPPAPAKKAKAKSRALVVFAAQDFVFGAATRKLLGEDGEALVRKAAEITSFKGKKQSVLDIVAPAGFAVDRLFVVGTGPVTADKPNGAAPHEMPKTEKPKIDPSDFVSFGGFVAGKLGQGAAAVVMFDLPQKALDGAGAVADFMLGMRLRDYRFDLYKTKKKEDDETKVTDILIAVEDPAAAKKAAKAREAIADGVMTARSLVNEPANILYPEEFANRAKELTKLGVEVEILDIAAMRKLGMGALLGVGQGSVRESRVAIMRWRGAKGPKVRPVAFIGKGVCFDTGGISIKPAGGMEDMKGDMAGAACVTGLIAALAGRKAKVDAIGAIGLVENMPGPDAQRPGDIVKSMSGQTIEIINTDAEGRLVLADVLWYIQDKYKPSFMIDLATLTGAIMVALGQEHAGLFSNDDELSSRLSAAAQETGEKVWRMPLGPAYDKLIDSRFADMKNTGGRHGGSITAAQFLQRFVNNVPWAHLDIAGVGMSSPSTDINQSWGSGWGVRLLDRLVADHYES